ncbi:MAG: hypothetical protein ACI4PX_05630 [Ruminococcus sp.]
MNRLKKSLSILTAGIVTAVLFAGCSDSEKDILSSDLSESSQTEFQTESVNSVTETPQELSSAPETTTVTTVPPHISPVETVSYSMASELGQINEILNYDTNKTLEEQNVSDITKGIIILLFRNYWATEKQRNKIIAKQNYDRMKLEEKKKEKYNTDNIFINKHKNSSIDILENKQEKSLVKIDDMKWYKKIWRRIKNFFRK